MSLIWNQICVWWRRWRLKNSHLISPSWPPSEELLFQTQASYIFYLIIKRHLTLVLIITTIIILTLDFEILILIFSDCDMIFTNCGETECIISSQNYPGVQIGNLNCRFIFRSISNDRIRMKFDMAIADSDSDSKWVYIYFLLLLLHLHFHQSAIVNCQSCSRFILVKIHAQLL